MTLKMARVILFTARMEEMSRFYGEVLGLKRVCDEPGWREFTAGGIRIALHSGPASPGRKGPKLVFHAKDVARLRRTLTERGARSAKSAKLGASAFVTAATQTEIPSSSPAASVKSRGPRSMDPGGDSP